MANYFSLLLVAATFITGIVWAIDKFRWAPVRAQQIRDAEEKAGTQLDEDARSQLAPQPVWVEQCVSIFPVIAIVMILRSFIYEPFQIPSGSMKPTLLVGDFILVEKFSYGIKDPVFRSKLIETGEPERGDVAVFKYPVDTNVDYIKRIVGLPGDRVIYKNKQLYIQPACENEPCQGLEKIELTPVNQGEFKKGFQDLYKYTEALGDVEHDILIDPSSAERIVSYYQQPGTQTLEWLVPEGQYFAMGDNRDDSRDSRFFGFVKDEHLVGRAVAIWISFELERGANDFLPRWVPTGVRFNRIGGIG